MWEEKGDMGDSLKQQGDMGRIVKRQQFKLYKSWRKLQEELEWGW